MKGPRWTPRGSPKLRPRNAAAGQAAPRPDRKGLLGNRRLRLVFLVFVPCKRLRHFMSKPRLQCYHRILSYNVYVIISCCMMFEQSLHAYQILLGHCSWQLHMVVSWPASWLKQQSKIAADHERLSRSNTPQDAQEWAWLDLECDSYEAAK